VGERPDEALRIGHSGPRAARLRSGRSLATGSFPLLTCGQADVVARLLDELAGVYRGEELGTLAGALSQMIDSQLDEQK
jgi:hypothetical protein